MGELFGDVAGMKIGSVASYDMLAALIRAVAREPLYLKKADVESAEIDATHKQIRILGIDEAGDGGETKLVRVVGEPSGHVGWVRSVDRFLPDGTEDEDLGGYWIYALSVAWPEIFGAPANGIDSDAAAINALHDYANATGCAVMYRGVTYCIDATVTFHPYGSYLGGGFERTIFKATHANGFFKVYDCPRTTFRDFCIDGQGLVDVCFHADGSGGGNATTNGGMHLSRVFSKNFKVCGFYLSPNCDGFRGYDTRASIDAAFSASCPDADGYIVETVGSFHGAHFGGTTGFGLTMRTIAEPGGGIYLGDGMRLGTFGCRFNACQKGYVRQIGAAGKFTRLQGWSSVGDYFENDGVPYAGGPAERQAHSVLIEGEFRATIIAPIKDAHNYAEIDYHVTGGGVIDLAVAGSAKQGSQVEHGAPAVLFCVDEDSLVIFDRIMPREADLWLSEVSPYWTGLLGDYQVGQSQAGKNRFNIRPQNYRVLAEWDGTDATDWSGSGLGSGPTVVTSEFLTRGKSIEFVGSGAPETANLIYTDYLPLECRRTFLVWQVAAKTLAGSTSQISAKATIGWKDEVGGDDSTGQGHAYPETSGYGQLPVTIAGAWRFHTAMTFVTDPDKWLRLRFIGNTINAAGSSGSNDKHYVDRARLVAIDLDF